MEDIHQREKEEVVKIFMKNILVKEQGLKIKMVMSKIILLHMYSVQRKYLEKMSL